MSENGTQGIDYLSLEGLVTDETRAWDGAQQGLPPGDYKVKVTGVEKKPSSNNNPQISVQFEVTEGAEKGRHARNWYTLTKDAIGRLLQLLQAVGMTLDQKKGFAPQALMGRELVIGVFADSYDGEINPMTGKADKKHTTKVFNERSLAAWAQIAAAQAAKANAQPST